MHTTTKRALDPQSPTPHPNFQPEKAPIPPPSNLYAPNPPPSLVQCEGKLAYLQASEPGKKWRMVISMSVGAPGPLTIEKLFFE